MIFWAANYKWEHLSSHSHLSPQHRDLTRETWHIYWNIIEILKKWKQNYLNWRSQLNITLTSIDCRNPHISRSSTLYPDKAWRGFYFSLCETLYFVPWSDQGAPDDLVSPSSWLQSELRNLLSPGGQWSSPHWNNKYQLQHYQG